MSWAQTADKTYKLIFGQSLIRVDPTESAAKEF